MFAVIPCFYLISLSPKIHAKWIARMCEVCGLLEYQIHTIEKRGALPGQVLFLD